MPLHDWTRVGAYAYHDFHTAWLVAVRNALNRGILPAGYYARAEQVAGDIGRTCSRCKPARRPAARPRRWATRRPSGSRWRRHRPGCG